MADTKFKHDARKLFNEGGEIAGKRPETLRTDGLPAYRDAFNKEFYTNTKQQSQHINAIKLTGHFTFRTPLKKINLIFLFIQFIVNFTHN